MTLGSKYRSDLKWGPVDGLQAYMKVQVQCVCLAYYYLKRGSVTCKGPEKSARPPKDQEPSSWCTIISTPCLGTGPFYFWQRCSDLSSLQVHPAAGIWCTSVKHSSLHRLVSPPRTREVQAPSAQMISIPLHAEHTSNKPNCLLPLAHAL